RAYLHRDSCCLHSYRLLLTGHDGRCALGLLVGAEAVIEAGCAKAREHRVVETLRTPEHDRLDDGAPRPAQPERGVTGEPALQPVADAAYAGPAADDAPFLHPQDDMNPLSA